MADKKCLRCGGFNLEPGTLQSAGRISFLPENALAFPRQQSQVLVRANICLDCGTLDLVGDAFKAQSLTSHLKAA
jgi:hypothetical protein